MIHLFICLTSSGQSYGALQKYLCMLACKEADVPQPSRQKLGGLVLPPSCLR